MTRKIFFWGGNFISVCSELDPELVRNPSEPQQLLWKAAEETNKNPFLNELFRETNSLISFHIKMVSLFQTEDLSKIQ